MDLTKIFSPERFTQALESWSWIGIEDKVPVFTSLFGDVVLQAEDGFWWLDTVEGSLTRRWRDDDALRADLTSAAGRRKYLLADLAAAAEQRGLHLAAEQVYDFKHPPVLGGEPAPENLDVIDFVVGLNVAGQIHEQVRDLPPGAPISINISG